MNLRAATRRDFKLEMLLGTGQSAQVYLALAPDGRQVALKIPLRQTLVGSQGSERFSQEVALMLSLNHPHLVRALAGRSSGDEPFLALEYFPQGSLETQLARGGLSRDEALVCLQQVGQALSFLHERHIIHQDVKPSNVFISAEGYKLGDLGVAKTPHHPRPLERAGSPFYMAPELFAGEGSTTASDTYSLGVMAFELLVGRRPFAGQSYDELSYAHLHLPPPTASAPREYAALLQAVLHKDPHKRATLKAFLEGLHPVSETQESLPSPVRKPLLGWFRRRS